LRKDGETIWVEVEVSRTYFEGEEGLLTILSDITERKQTEVMLRRLSNVVEQTDDPVVVTDLDGTIQYVNPAAERITGYTAAEMLGQNRGSSRVAKCRPGSTRGSGTRSSPAGCFAASS
jgi:PAS domain-containing protein